MAEGHRSPNNQGGHQARSGEHRRRENAPALFLVAFLQPGHAD
jgi:hypothetical protein